ncbi:MAG: hypothetical protein ACO1N7_09890 [Sphingobacteriaceae bacterium]
MHNRLILTFAIFTITLFSGCELIGDIFQAGFYTAIILIVLVIALLIWLFNKFR